MGALFGIANQLLLVAVGLGLTALVCIGYLMWWRRRPTRGVQPSLCQAWRQMTLSLRLLSLAVALLLGVALPVLGVSLALLLAIDALLGMRAPQPLPTP